jgi:purine-binding chemotaxis protein CheW
MQRLDFLCVLAGARRIAMPLNLVLSVEEAGPLTPLPFSPPLVEGLVMALDRVLPQMPLAAVLGEEGRPGGVLVVLAARDDVRALRVDQVAGMVQIDVEAVQPIDDLERAEQPLISAHFTALDGEWSVLDYARLTADQPMETEPASGAALIGISHETTAATPPTAESGEHLPLLQVKISGESYAVPIADIVEILVPGAMRSMPATPDWVAGLIDRRGTPLLIVSASVLLGRPSMREFNTVLVIEIPRAGEIGIAIDRAVGIERIHQADIHAVTQDMPGVARYFVAGSEHIIGIIDPITLTGQVRDEIAALVPRPEKPVDETPTVETIKLSRRLLSMRVGRELLALPLERVERIQASVVLTPLPQPGTGFHAMTDVGDATVPVLDLRRDITDAGSALTPPCTLVQIEGALAGLAVDQVLRIEDIPDADVQDVATHPLLPISHVARSGSDLLSVLVIDRVLPPLDDVLAATAPSSQVQSKPAGRSAR